MKIVTWTKYENFLLKMMAAMARKQKQLGWQIRFGVNKLPPERKGFVFIGQNIFTTCTVAYCGIFSTVRKCIGISWKP
jgi:hypothetical protein